ncbi:MAG: tetratricopeptide repeat protein, partial [Holophagales bacterium]|nr:tetratricopeptide repeat protein [Holophagales bacterium]
LEHHSQLMVRELADLYVKRARSEGAQVVAARALASLGGHLQAAGRTMSLELFQQAVVFDPSNEAALLGLASYFEKRGGPYETSTLYLRQLVEHRPQSREGRLRLAVNLLRIADLPGEVAPEARRSEAVTLFEGLLEGEETDWIHSLAAQELARHHASSGRTDQALEVLRDALERLPGDQKLHVQMAFLLDSSRLTRRARKIAERLTVQATYPDTAPRGLYNQWPTSALFSDRRELQEGAARRLDVLSGAAGIVGRGEE